MDCHMGVVGVKAQLLRGPSDLVPDLEHWYHPWTGPRRSSGMLGGFAVAIEGSRHLFCYIESGHVERFRLLDPSGLEGNCLVFRQR